MAAKSPKGPQPPPVWVGAHLFKLTRNRLTIDQPSATSMKTLKVTQKNELALPENSPPSHPASPASPYNIQGTQSKGFDMTSAERRHTTTNSAITLLKNTTQNPAPFANSTGKLANQFQILTSVFVSTVILLTFGERNSQA